MRPNPVDVLKVINCAKYFKMAQLLDVANWPAPEEFDAIWKHIANGNPFLALCQMDRENQSRVWDWAEGLVVEEEIRLGLRS